MTKEKALIIQNKFIGDVLISSLIAKNLKYLLNFEVEVHFLCYNPAVGILENNPYVDKIISFDDKKLKKIPNLLQLCRKLKKENYTILIDPYAKLQSRIITSFVKAKTSVSFEKLIFKHLYTHNYKLESYPKTYCSNTIEDRLRLLNPFNPENKKLDSQTEVFLTFNEIQSAKNQLDKCGLLSKPILMIGVVGSSKSKSWTYSYMRKLIEYLLSLNLYHILLNYIPSQQNEVDEVLEGIDKNHQSLFLKPLGNSIRELAALLTLCTAFIGNEGGGVNLAKAFKIPTFTIYSPHKFRKDWGCYQDLLIHQSVHLEDVESEIYSTIKKKELFNQTEELYKKITFEIVKPKIDLFLFVNGINL